MRSQTILDFKPVTCGNCHKLPFEMNQEGQCVHCGERIVPAAYRHAQTASGAVISDCKQYRYKLWRIWDHNKPTVMFLMLNPSTADAVENDRTIKRCIDFAKDWGYGGLYVCNLFAYRSKKPKDLYLAANPFGPDNHKYITETAGFCKDIICAWGNGKVVFDLLEKKKVSVLDGINKGLFYLRLSKDGTPWHPLYLPKTCSPISYFPKTYPYEPISK